MTTSGVDALARPVGPLTLVDHLPAVRFRDPALVVGFALLTALAAQITIPLAFTPVPISGQTFAVLLSGGLLGAKRGGLAQLLYVSLGALGLPVYANGQGGWESATGSTLGYLVGFVVAAVVVGALADRQADRQVITALPAFALGSTIILAFGAIGLSLRLGVPMVGSEGSAWSLGVAPFLAGDVLKVALAGFTLPLGWRLLNR